MQEKDNFTDELDRQQREIEDRKRRRAPQYKPAPQEEEYND